MPPARGHKPTKPHNRSAPYSKPSSDIPINSEPVEDDTSSSPPASMKHTSKAPSKEKSSTKEPDRSDLPSSYRDIPLEEILGEVPVYENTAVIRRKLNKLLENKSKIPGSTKSWTQASLASEIQAIAQNSTPVKTHQGVGNSGPSVASLRRFLKLTGGMAGGDSESYYFGNMLLEKLRIWNGEKKTKARENAEDAFPHGRDRRDPRHTYVFCRKGETPSYSDVANVDRGYLYFR